MTSKKKRTHFPSTGARLLKKNKYTERDIVRMEYMRYDLKMSYAEIGLSFGVGGRAIETQLAEKSIPIPTKRLKVPNVTNWDFSKDNVC